MELSCLECNTLIDIGWKFPYFEIELKCPECGTEYVTDWDEGEEGPCCWLVRKEK